MISTIIYEVNENDMDRACSTNREKRNALYVILGEARRKEIARKTKTSVSG
jgi:hypothetical protein